VYEFVHQLVNPKYLIYFGLLTKITLVRGVKKLVISSNRTWKLRQINLVQVNNFKLMIVIRVQEQDNNANGYLVWFKWYLDSIVF
jgi:hypothetical protein